MFSFVRICKSNNIEYIKKYYENNKNIYEYKKMYTFEFEYAFIFACANNYLNFAKWLLEIKPTIICIIQNIYVINKVKISLLQYKYLNIVNIKNNKNNYYDKMQMFAKN